MKLAFVPALLLSAASVPLAAAVDPALLDLTPPNTKILTGVNVDQALQSTFGQFALSKLPQTQGMMQFMAATGFDFRRDLRELLIATDATGSPTTRNGLISMRGRFQPAKFAGLAALAGTAPTTYGGLALLTIPGSRQNAGEPSSAAFLDNDTLVLGSEEAVKSAIDRRTGRIHYSGALAKTADAASGLYDVWVATTEPLSSFIAQGLRGIPNGLPATVFSSVLSATAGVRFDSTGASVTGEAIAASSQDAQTLAGMAQVILTLAQAGKVPSSPEGAALLRSASVAAEGSTVRVKLAISELQLEQMLENRAGARKVALQGR